MASIRERIDATGKKSYHVQIRIKGFPPQTQSLRDFLSTRPGFKSGR